jgi:hypothetical protein
VHDVAQVAVGALTVVAEVRLPLAMNVPKFGSVEEPLVNVVAETEMFHPAPLAVLSFTVNCWSAGCGSTTLWTAPLRRSVQFNDAGDVRLSVPPEIASDAVAPESTDKLPFLVVRVAA